MSYNILSLSETNLEYSNRMSFLYKFPLLSLQSNVKYIFHTLMTITQIVVLTAHGAAACNLIFELSAAVLVISDQQTKMGNVRVIQYCDTFM